MKFNFLKIVSISIINLVVLSSCVRDFNNKEFTLCSPEFISQATYIDTICKYDEFHVLLITPEREFMAWESPNISIIRKTSPKDSNFYFFPKHYVRTDTILYTNAIQHISPFTDGLIMEIKYGGNEVRYSYLNDSLKTITEKLIDEGVYKINNDTILHLTHSHSLKDFNEVASDGLFFLTPPGFFYDKKINLKELETYP